MKRLMYTGAMLCAMALMTGCSEEEQMAGQAQSGNFSVTATTGTDTRTTVEGYTVKWSVDDQIYVYGGEAYGTLKLTDGAGSTSGTFTGTIKNGTANDLKYAVYPAPVISGENKSVTFPETYQYPYDSNSPMYAAFESSTPNKLAFKHLCGMMRLTINGIPSDEAKTLTLESKDSNIAGTATLTEGTDGLSLDAISEEGKSIAITIPTNQTGPVFDIPLPVGTYTNGITVKLTINGQNAVAETTVKNITIEAGKMLEMAALTYVHIDGETPSFTQSAKTVEEANQALANGEPSVTIDAVDASQNGDITVTVHPTTNNASTTIAVNSLQTGENKLIVKAADNETVGQDINLLLAAAEGTEQAKINLEVNTKDSHVTLAPTNENTSIVIDEATVLTGETTFVIEKGVTIKSLVVNGGNVRVNAGAKIEAMEKSSGNSASTVYLYKETEAVIPENYTDFTVIDAAVYDLKKALSNGESYQLTTDVSIVGQSLNVPAGKAATLDLNGHTLTADNGATGKITVHGTFTLKDSSADKSGKIMADKDYEAGVYSGGLIAIVGEQASMTMESGNIYAVRTDATNKGQFGIALLEGGDFTMTGGKIEAGWYAVSGNGNNKTQNSVIHISGGELISTADYALYLPQSGTTTVSGGTIYGEAGGITIQRGTLNVEGNALITSKGTGNTGNWGDGTGKLGCAAINANAQYGDCTVNITGGTLTAESEALIAKGTAHTATINVTGGTFSDPSVLNYMAAGANVNIKLLANISIDKPELAKGYTLNAANATANLDLNGKDIINTAETTDATPYTQIFTVVNGTLNISGSGNIRCDASNTAKDDGYRIAVEAQGQGTVNIHGGSYYNTQKRNTQIDLIYAQQNGQINIYGGTFESEKYGTPDNDTNGRYWVLNLKNADKGTAGITVSGGTFINFNPANPNMDDNASYLATGYEVTRDNQVCTEAHKVADGRKTYIVRKAAE